MCKSAVDLAETEFYDALLVEQNRPKKMDRFIASSTKPVLLTINSNTSTVLISSLTQAAAIVLYLIKYHTKTSCCWRILWLVYVLRSKSCAGLGGRKQTSVHS